MAILNLEDLPSDPLERLIWLGGVKDAVASELDDAYAEAYAEARLRGLFDTALQFGPYGKKRALALTRRWNNTQARMIRWGDHIDRTSSAYDGS